MPSVDHCPNKPTEMATITNSLEVFDTYKSPDEDKDSDEESFHLPIDDDDLETKIEDLPTTNGTTNETEEDILDKFDNTPVAVAENLDPKLVKTLLNAEELRNGDKSEPEDEVLEKNTATENKKSDSNKSVESKIESEEDKDKVNGDAVLDDPDCQVNGDVCLELPEQGTEAGDPEDIQAGDPVQGTVAGDPEKDIQAGDPEQGIEAGDIEAAESSKDSEMNPVTTKQVDPTVEYLESAQIEDVKTVVEDSSTEAVKSDIPELDEDVGMELENNDSELNNDVGPALEPIDDVTQEKVDDKDVKPEKIEDKDVKLEKINDKDGKPEKIDDKDVNLEKIEDDNVDREKVEDNDVNMKEVEDNSAKLDPEDSTELEKTDDTGSKVDDVSELVKDDEPEQERAAAEESSACQINDKLKTAEEPENVVAEVQTDDQEPAQTEETESKVNETATKEVVETAPSVEVEKATGGDLVKDGEDEPKQMEVDTDDLLELRAVATLVDEEPMEVETPETQKTEPEAETTKEKETAPDKDPSRSENSNDSDDLMDVSVIRDAEEDNAESAYNEANPEDEYYDDRISDKNVEDDDLADKVEVAEEAIQDCDVIKETVYDVDDSDSGHSSSQVVVGDKDKAGGVKDDNVASEDYTEITLDEFTGQLVGGVQNDDDDDKTTDDDSEKRKTLKRAASEESDGSVTKKSKRSDSEPSTGDEAKRPVVVLKSLLSLSGFMKNKKTHKLSKYELEEFCLQKICEAIVHKSELGEVQHQLKVQEQLVETMRKEIQQLTKQARDLEIVNKKLINDLKQQSTTQKPLTPLKITRSVGLQVKFTPTFETTVKRRAVPTAPVQRVGLTNLTSKNQRTVPGASNNVVNRQPQVTAPQKQTIPPKTPILTQALQNRRSGLSDSATNRNAPQAAAGGARPVPAPAANKSATSSVIDLTDEDDKKGARVTAAAPNTLTPARPPAQRSVQGLTLRTTATPVRAINPGQQGIRLTTAQGKGSPITSVVTSSAPQLMYLVQSSPQSVLASGVGGGPKAVVVNLTANGVLTSALNGSAVSVIPKSSNTIQLKTLSPTKQVQGNKVVKAGHRHPAPLPYPPTVRVSQDKSLKPIPPKPHLTIRKTDTGIILQWRMPYDLDMYEEIASYQLYAYQETSAMPSTDMWRRVGDVKALALPMACTLTQFADKNRYYFAVRPVDIHKRIGTFSDPEEISL